MEIDQGDHLPNSYVGRGGSLYKHRKEYRETWHTKQHLNGRTAGSYPLGFPHSRYASFSMEEPKKNTWVRVNSLSTLSEPNP